jgi:hypothetical protein
MGSARSERDSGADATSGARLSGVYCAVGCAPRARPRLPENEGGLREIHSSVDEYWSHIE